MTNKTEMLSVPREWLTQVSLMQMSHEELQDQAVEFLCEPCDEPAPPEDVRAVVEEPVRLTAVATLIDDGDGGLEADWLLEGGTAELFEGMVLLAADNDPALCAEDGIAEVYRHPQRRLEMADVVKAHMEIPHCPVLTSNQCHALAMKLNACLDWIAEKNK